MQPLEESIPQTRSHGSGLDPVQLLPTPMTIPNREPTGSHSLSINMDTESISTVSDDPPVTLDLLSALEEIVEEDTSGTSNNYRILTPIIVVNIVLLFFIGLVITNPYHPFLICLRRIQNETTDH